MTTKTIKTTYPMPTRPGDYIPKPGDTIKLVNRNGTTIRKHLVVSAVDVVVQRGFGGNEALVGQIDVEGGGWVDVGPVDLYYNPKVRAHLDYAWYENFDPEGVIITPA